MKKYYRIVVDVQFGDLQDECDRLYDGSGYEMCFSDHNGDAVIDLLSQWDGYEFCDDDIRDEEPYWAHNGTDYVHTKNGYTLLYNATLGGVYMLYREATKEEVEFLNK